MKKWKRINLMAKIILTILLIPFVYFFIKSIYFEINGIGLVIPGPTLYKWYDIFLFDVIGYGIYFVFFIVVDIAFIIISSKLKKKK